MLWKLGRRVWKCWDGDSGRQFYEQQWFLQAKGTGKAQSEIKWCNPTAVKDWPQERIRQSGQQYWLQASGLYEDQVRGHPLSPAALQKRGRELSFKIKENPGSPIGKDLRFALINGLALN